jgi:hypothetical protein
MVVVSLHPPCHLSSSFSLADGLSMARQGFPSRWVGFPCPGPQTQCRRKRLKETVDMLARAAETKNGTGRKRLDGREEMTQRPEVYIMSLFVTFASNALSLVLQMIHATQLSPLIPGSQWIISGPSALVERAKEQLRQSGKLKSDKGDEELVSIKIGLASLCFLWFPSASLSSPPPGSLVFPASPGNFRLLLSLYRRRRFSTCVQTLSLKRRPGSRSTRPLSPPFSILLSPTVFVVRPGLRFCRVDTSSYVDDGTSAP